MTLDTGIALPKGFSEGDIEHIIELFNKISKTKSELSNISINSLEKKVRIASNNFSLESAHYLPRVGNTIVSPSFAPLAPLTTNELVEILDSYELLNKAPRAKPKPYLLEFQNKVPQVKPYSLGTLINEPPPAKLYLSGSLNEHPRAVFESVLVQVNNNQILSDCARIFAFQDTDILLGAVGSVHSNTTLQGAGNDSDLLLTKLVNSLSEEERSLFLRQCELLLINELDNLTRAKQELLIIRAKLNLFYKKFRYFLRFYYYQSTPIFISLFHFIDFTGNIRKIKNIFYYQLLKIFFNFSNSIK